MNKLLLVGNGFDIAHGLDVRYSDFIKYILKDWISNPNEDQKIFNVRNPIGRHGYEFAILDKIDFTKSTLKIYSSFKAALMDWNSRNSNYMMSFNMSNPLFEEALERSGSTTWAGFEKSYYDKLVELAKGNVNMRQQYGDIASLNRYFLEIKEAFLEYLTMIVNDKIQRESVTSISKYEEWLFRPKFDFKVDELLSESDMVDKLARPPITVLVLSFNYTPFLNRLYDVSKASNMYASTLHIHGELNSTTNPEIFGYGDEMDKEFKRLQDHDNPVLQHMKSFQYAKTDNYHRLEQFVESDLFQVDILGHSCGTCDRVMLNYIFEHQNCNRIRIHHHKGMEGYLDTYMNISRHFSLNNKQAMRSKVLPFNPEYAMPQAKPKEAKAPE